MNTTTRPLARLIATGATLAAIAAGSASAGIHPNDRPGAQGAGAAGSASVGIHPNDRAGAQGAGAAALVPATSDWVERAAQRATEKSSLAGAPIARTPDWLERAAVRSTGASLPASLTASVRHRRRHIVVGVRDLPALSSCSS